MPAARPKRGAQAEDADSEKLKCLTRLIRPHRLTETCYAGHDMLWRSRTAWNY
jgi:hypothetical protein